MFKKISNKKFVSIVFLVASAFVSSVFLYLLQNDTIPESAVYLLSDYKQIQKNNKVLIFSPHPDDETLAVGGLIYDYKKVGASVKLILVTDGNKHGLKEKRYDEYNKATELLGVKAPDRVYLNYPDGKLNKVSKEELAGKFQSEIDNFLPDIIVYSSSFDTHPDHMTIGKVLDGIHTEKIEKYSYLVHYSLFPNHKKYLPKNFLVPPRRLIQFSIQWNKYILDQDSESAKFEATKQYKTQLKNPVLQPLMYGMIRRNELLIKIQND